DDALVLGLTASPGYDMDKITEVCRNLGITNIAVRSEMDEDVAPYVYGIALEFVKVDVPEEAEEITVHLKKILDEKVEALRKYHVLDAKRPPNTRALLEAGNVLRAKINANKKNYHLYRALTIQAGAMKVNHAIDLVRSQGIDSLRNYLAKVVDDAQTKGGSRASKDLVKDARFEMVRRILDSENAEHPKIEKVKLIVQDQVKNNPNSRIIVFTHYRDTCDQVSKLLSEIPDVKPARFVGQATHGRDTGLKQKEQKEIIEKFKRGDFNVLVATSVAEEGLDIPSTDLVVFYEPIPSEIRTIQRRGRTGRHSPGRVVVILARRTKDEAFNYSSKRKEQKMHSQLDSLRRRLKVAKKIGSETGEEIEIDEILRTAPEEDLAEKKAKKLSKAQTLLSDFSALSSTRLKLQGNSIKNSEVMLDLRKIGIEFDELSGRSTDFVIGNDIAIIKESIDDFLSDIDKPALLSKIATLKERYRRPFMIVEGKSIKKTGIADKLPVYDILVELVKELRIPVIATNSPSDTAAFLASLVKAEMTKKEGERRKAPDQLEQYQIRMIQGLPNVTSVLAERLLERFGSVQAVMSASTNKLMEVDGVGKSIAEGIRKTATATFETHKEKKTFSF
ncbi:MAG: helicase-related protein, partial [Thermoplasmata archaeon]|nr:helicase-related protein [Thermoplasmata archaeon]